MDVGLGRVAGEFDVDEKAIAAEELGRGIEGVVDCIFGVGHHALEVSGRDTLALGEMDPHCEDRDVFSGRESVAADFVGGTTRVVGGTLVTRPSTGGWFR